MEIKTSAIAGTLESSDIQITLTHSESEENIIDLESPVMHLFEDEILKVIKNVLRRHQLKGVHVRAIDKGALNCTIAARMQTAVYRATGESLLWEGL